MTARGSRLRRIGLVSGLLLCACGDAAEAPRAALPAAGDSAATALPETPPDTNPLPAAQPPDSLQLALVDPAIPPAVAGEDGWMFEQATGADLDSDGDVERVVLTARVELYGGRPAWDDGQPWQVYVEEPDGTRTYLYARFLQLGTLTMRVGLANAARLPSVILLEHLPDRLSLYEVVYTAPGQVVIAERFQSPVDPRGETASPALP